MRTLHMNTEDAWALVRTLQEQREALTSAFTALQQQVHAIVGTHWQGPAAEQYLQEYEQLHISLKHITNTMQVIEDILRYEVTHWLEVDSRFGT